MEHTYTRLVRSKVDEINNENLSDDYFIHDLGDSDNTEELIKLVNEFNRPFSEGLILLIKGSSDNTFDNLDEIIEYVKLKLKPIAISDDKKNILGWLKGKVEHPKAGEATRDRIYRLCFALSVPLDDVNWFFNHVYFQRSFNCRRIEEAIYYYCFKNNYDYGHAQQLISEIRAFPEQKSQNTEATVYTTEIQKQLDTCSTDEELKQYFRKRKWTFQENQANQRAMYELREFLENIQGKETDRAVAKKIKKIRTGKSKDVEPETTGCGLIVQEILALDEPHEEPCKGIDPKTKTDKHETDSLLNQLLDGNVLSSLSTMLKCIYGKDIHMENINLPSKRRENFPTPEGLSKLLKGGSCTSSNYDAIRKCLILLQFYEFWCEYKLAPSKFPEDAIDVYETYLSEANDCLASCGYDKLYPGNSYDRLFMLCSGSSTPLEAFRTFLGTTT